MTNTSRLIDLIEQWEKAREQGRPVTPQELCPDDPTLAAELGRQIEFLEVMTQQGAPTKAGPATVTGPPPHFQLSSSIDFERVAFFKRGGLGVVFVGTDRRLHREVAIKMLKNHNDPLRAGELLREAEITGKLEHPGVVPVYCLGECADGEGTRPFYAMKYIQGDTLDAWIRRFHAHWPEPATGGRGDGPRSIEFRGLLSRFVSVCNTVAYAHNRGIIHRDIKPDNIMIGKFGETLLVDWGLAMPVNRDATARGSGERTLMLHSSNQTGDSSGHPIGTPAYMSPEQAEGTADLTPAADIYCLGATLYKLLTGELPCKGSNVREVCDKVKAGAIDPPTKAPRALAAVCLKAMARKPADRYASAQHLAADIENWLADEPVSVQAESRSAKAWRWLRRHRGIAATAAAGLIATLVLALLGLIRVNAIAEREHEGREQSLRHAGKFAARLMAAEIDLRWRVLEQEAADPRLVELLDRPEPDRAALQNWVNETYLRHLNESICTSWFVVDREGGLAAIQGNFTERQREQVIGRQFRDRDYFHGQDKFFANSKDAAVSPISEPYLSRAFRSKIDKSIKVAFSVPIHARAGKDARIIGVLGITMPVGSFKALQTLRDPMAILVDTRRDFLDGIVDGEGNAGLILNHGRELPEMHRVTEADLKFLRSLGDRPADADTILRERVDPVDHSTGWTAAVEPVIVESRAGNLRDTGWVVMVQGK